MSAKHYTGLILAAGLSSRMGVFKPLFPLAGKAMIDWSIEHMLDAGINDIIVVTGHETEALTHHLNKYTEQGQPIKTVYNPDYQNGSILTSIKTGLSQPLSCDAIFITLADLPALRPSVYAAMMEAYEKNQKSILIPVYEGQSGHPCLVSTSLVPDILAHEGKGGLRDFWKGRENSIGRISVDHPGSILDIDEPEDISRLQNSL